MDENDKKRFEEDISSFEDGLLSSTTMDNEVRNSFMQTVSIMKRMHQDTQMAHLRIDHRKDELESMRKSLDKLTEQIGVMSQKVSELAVSQTGFARSFNRNIEAQRMQLESMKKMSRRTTIYVTAISVITLIGTFGSLKGASLAASIWGVIGKLL